MREPRPMLEETVVNLHDDRAHDEPNEGQHLGSAHAQEPMDLLKPRLANALLVPPGVLGDADDAINLKCILARGRGFRIARSCNP